MMDMLESGVQTVTIYITSFVLFSYCQSSEVPNISKLESFSCGFRNKISKAILIFL